MSRPVGYGVVAYGDMITCEPRMTCYADALRRAVTPGCTVLDIGTGTGIFALLACQYGAGRVIAVEPDESIWLARVSAEANGCADRITFFQGLSSDLDLPGGADVIVSDIRGALPLFQGHIAAVKDARTRLLAPGGVMIPMRDTIRAALVEVPKLYQSCTEPWLENKFGVDLHAGHPFAVNTSTKGYLASDSLMSAAQDLAVLDYRRVTDPHLSAKAELVANRAGVAHGLLLWFDAELADGIGYSNAPGAPELVYGQSFYPFERPLALDVGDRVEASVGARLIDGDYVWTWNSRFFPVGASAPQAQFRQSSFLAQVRSPESLARRTPGFVPQPKQAHAVDSLCLSLIDGKTSLRTIADRLAATFPEVFVDQKSAFDHVTEVAERYYHRRD